MIGRVIGFFTIVTMICGLLPAPAGATTSNANAPLQTTADSAILMEASTGKIIFEKNPHKKLYPASVTKLMTLVVAMEALEAGKVSLEDKVVASERAWEMGGSEIYLAPGDELTMEEMLISIAVGSANDACVAVAEHLCGSYEAFVEEMNRKAEELGMKNTHFVNPHGLPAENHYTSAYDMAILSQYALKFPKLMELVSIKHYKIREGTDAFMQLDNTNKLLWWYDGADGFKTGWTSEAKYCLASTVQRDGIRFIAVVLGVPEVRGHFNESIKLYNYGFARYRFKQLAEAGSAQGTVLVGKSKQEMVTATAQKPIGTIVEKGKDKGISYRVELLPEVVAPIAKGQKLGEAVILQDNQELARVDLVAAEEVAKASLMEQFHKTLQKVYGFHNLYEKNTEIAP